MKEPGFTYRLFKNYLKFWHDKIYYRQTYTLDTENIPADGTPLLIVSNHQNCLNDPLGVLFTINDRKPNFITRADVFALSPLADKFLRSIGLLPAFRLQYEGAESLEENTATFRTSEKALLDGATVMMFPEAGHQNKHWLGTFSFGYTRLAFEAAEMGEFKKDIMILPSCNHYSSYFGMRNQFMVKFGKPISLAPYYELYKTKPRTAQRQVNKLVRAQIHEMMLDVRDVENYEPIDFIRMTYGRGYAVACGTDPENLPERLETDKRLVAVLDQAKAGNPEEVQSIYDDALRYKAELKKTGLDDRSVSTERTPFSVAGNLLLDLILLPLWIFSLWPALPMYLLPKPFAKRTGDEMFEGTFLFALNMLFIFPILAILTFVLDGVFCSWILAAVHVLAIPYLCLFAWNYKEHAVKDLRSVRKACLGKSRVSELKVMRRTLWTRISMLAGKSVD